MENKKPLVKDSEGYYTVQLGTIIGENVVLHKGTPHEITLHYPAKDFAVALNILKEGLKEKPLLGEMGSPKYYENMPRDQRFTMFRTVMLDRVSHEVVDVEMIPVGETETFIIKGKIKPCGPNGHMLAAFIAEDNFPVFGLRSIANIHLLDEKVHTRTVERIITWDWILE